VRNDALALRAINTIRFLSVDAVQKAKSGTRTPMGWRRWRTCCGRSTCDTPGESHWPARPVHPLLRPRLHALYSLSPHRVQREPGRPEEFRSGEQTRAPEPGTPGRRVTTGLGQGSERRRMAMASRMLAQRSTARARDRLPPDRGALLRRDLMEGFLRSGVSGRIPPAREPRGVLRRQPDHIEGHGPRFPGGRGGRFRAYGWNVLTSRTATRTSPGWKRRSTSRSRNGSAPPW